MTLTCNACGAEFERKLGRGPIPKYCSADCRLEAIRVRALVERPEVACEHCGKAMIRRRRDHRFCSGTCKARAADARRQAARTTGRAVLALNARGRGAVSV